MGEKSRIKVVYGNYWRETVGEVRGNSFRTRARNS